MSNSNNNEANLNNHGATTIVSGQCILTSSDGKQFEIDRSAAALSILVKEMIEEEDTDDKPEVPLPNVKAHVLQKVVEFSEHYVSDPMPEIKKPLESSNMNEVVPEWYAKFVNLEQELLFELILSANYMDNKPLLDLTCAKVASMLKNKTPEQIRETFNITNDFTPEEEARVREENRWCEEAN